MASFRRTIFPTRFWIDPGTSWRAALVLLAASGFIVSRACEYDFDAITGYLVYVGLYVALPGVVALHAVNRGPVSLLTAVALGLPTGFALEIFTFLGLAALDAKEIYAWVPLGWLMLAVGVRWRSGAWPVRVRVSAHHAGLAAGLCLAFLATALVAAAQMFAESPLVDGLPQRAIFHDWVYLVSRAAVIKHHWPLDDPSLSGTPMQYHYFMMVHAAAASWTAGVELTTVLLRLMYVPMGAALVAQTFLLGRAVARSPWGGVVAALLTLVASELSFAPKGNEAMFLGLFTRWLFVSPTFYFGLVFCGALLIAVARCARLRRCGPLDYGWLLLLGAAGTGAKGTVLPVVVGALGVWTAWQWYRGRRLPRRTLGFGVCLTAAFLLVYVPTMSQWRTGDAALRPFRVFELASFWKDTLPEWQQALVAWLPSGLARGLAAGACAVVVFAGTCGVRLLALPYLLWVDRSRRDPLLVSWLGAFLAACLGMGTLLALHSHGELYVFLLVRLPLAVLAAGFVVAAFRRCALWWQAVRTEAGPAFVARRSRPVRRAWVAVLAGACGLILVVQTAGWWSRNSGGLRDVLRASIDQPPDRHMRELREALLWVRQNTEPNAVLVANACTPENMKKDHWGALDRTLTGVHFYYSALSERRLWFEGPSYILDTTRARLRASMAANFFYRGRPLRADAVSAGPTYVLVDRSLQDGAEVSLPVGRLVFANPRMEVYRLSEVDPVFGYETVAVADGALD